MSVIFYRFIWNLSEHWLKFPLGRFAPHVFHQAYMSDRKATTSRGKNVRG